MQGLCREILSPSPCVKIEGLVFHGMARAIRLINSLLHGKNENVLNIHREFADNFRKIIFHENYSKINFLIFSVDFKIFRELSENSPRISRKIIVHEFYQKHFPEFHNFPKFSENFETILIKVHFQFCSAVESIGQDGAILPDYQPVKLRESRAG